MICTELARQRSYFDDNIEQSLLGREAEGSSPEEDSHLVKIQPKVNDATLISFISTYDTRTASTATSNTGPPKDQMIR